MTDIAIPVYFPYDFIREVQHSLLSDISTAITQKKHLIAHAPTGLGKTAAALAPCLALAEQHGLTILFLTSRHTQHRLAIETTRSIKDKFKLEFSGVSMIGKRWMCAQPGIDGLGSAEFSEYCSLLRKDGQCSFYTKTRPKEGALSVDGQHCAEQLTQASPLQPEAFVKRIESFELCPYEIGLAVSSQSRVIITDYYYAFHPTISEHFLTKINKPLGSIILIIDEGHNLPSRMRELLSTSLTTSTIHTAKKEAEKFGFTDCLDTLSELDSMLWGFVQDGAEEGAISKEEVLTRIERIIPLQDLITQFEDYADHVRNVQKRSSLGTISQFLNDWSGPDQGFVRFWRKAYNRKTQEISGIHYHCLDPSLITGPIISQTYATILMSGTLTPTSMYADVLGFEAPRTIQKEYPNPFEEANRLALIVPKTTTKFSKRSERQFMEIAGECARICETIPGNVAIFFPSYFIRDAVATHFSSACRKTQFSEDPSLTKQEREEMIDRFKTYKDSGAVLLCAASGSFGEGVDLPGDYLRGVVIVGLPLSKPDLETNALIKYYDQKYGKGWEYGYTLPAMTRTLQNAGRCIRTETDRGVIIFLDERYAWPTYISCFPRSWNLKIKRDHIEEIKRFFLQTN